MTNIEYFKHMLHQDHFLKLEWFYSVFAMAYDNNKYTFIKDNKYYVNLFTTTEPEVITNVIPNRPLLSINEGIIITKDDLENVTDTDVIKTTLGRVIINKILLVDNFGNKIPYINKTIKPTDIENIIAENMHTKNIITVPEYIKFVDSASFLQGLSRITTISATEKSVVAPPGITKFKKEVVNEFNAKYGEDWSKDQTRIVEFESRLKAYDAEWLKGDPTDGKLTSGKVKNNARSKMFLTFGAEAGFDKKGENPNLIVESLGDGYPDDIDKLITMFNTSRAGSYDRGKETQKGGAVAKDILRATSSITIIDGDCGSTKGKSLTVTEDNYENIAGRNIFEGNKIVTVDNPKAYIGKTILLRSPMYCISTGSNICSVCAGSVMSRYKTGIPFLVTDISGILLKSALKSMHGTTLSTVNVDITGIIK